MKSRGPVNGGTCLGSKACPRPWRASEATMHSRSTTASHHEKTIAVSNSKCQTKCSITLYIVIVPALTTCLY